jgi:hypothetical protein
MRKDASSLIRFMSRDRVERLAHLLGLHLRLTRFGQRQQRMTTQLPLLAASVVLAFGPIPNGNRQTSSVVSELRNRKPALAGWPLAESSPRQIAVMRDELPGAW